MQFPSKNQYIKYKAENDNTGNKCQFISRAGKFAESKHFFSVVNLENC